MLVLAPTRELASQIADSARGYDRKFSKLGTVATVFGGVPTARNRRDTAAGVDILVATPGRLMDLIEQRCMSLSDLEILVLDEADQMLDLGFIHTLKRIIKMLPRDRQSLFFSATMPKASDQGPLLRLPDRSGRGLCVAPAATTAERVEQYATFVNQQEKQAISFDPVLPEETRSRPRAGVHPHQARRRPRREAARRRTASASNAIHGNKSSAAA